MARGVNAMNLKNAGIERNCGPRVGKNARTLSEGRLCAGFKLVYFAMHSTCTIKSLARTLFQMIDSFRPVEQRLTQQRSFSIRTVMIGQRTALSGRASGRILKSGFSTFARGGR